MKIFLTLFIFLLALLPTSPILRAEESSQKNFTSVTQADMDQIANLHERAAGLAAQRNFRDAIHVYSEILLTEPDDDDAYTGLGQAYMVLGDFKRAKDAHV